MTVVTYVTNHLDFQGVIPDLANRLIEAWQDMRRITASRDLGWKTLGAALDHERGWVYIDDIRKDKITYEVLVWWLGPGWIKNRGDQYFLCRAYRAALPYINNDLPIIYDTKTPADDDIYPDAPQAGNLIRLTCPLPEYDFLPGAVGIVEGIVDMSLPELSVVFRFGKPFWLVEAQYPLVSARVHDGVRFSLQPSEVSPTGKFMDMFYWEGTSAEYTRLTGRRFWSCCHRVPVWEWSPS